MLLCSRVKKNKSCTSISIAIKIKDDVFNAKIKSISRTQSQKKDRTPQSNCGEHLILKIGNPSAQKKSKTAHP